MKWNYYRLESSSPLLRVTLNRVRHCPSKIPNEASEVVADNESDDNEELHNDNGLNPAFSQPTGGTSEARCLEPETRMGNVMTDYFIRNVVFFLAIRIVDS